MKWLLALFPIALFGADLNQLLQQYEKSSELSRITKKETAGLVTVFDKERIEAMQAYTLGDLLKNLPMLNLTRAPNNLPLFTNASLGYVPPAAIRLYINDHDVTSTSFGSAVLIWGEMPIEYIDHVEVYRGSSSIEFGNEPGIIIIKVYTKLAFREVGKKVRSIVDQRGSKGLDGYMATILSEESDLFAYAHAYDYKPKILYRDGYRIDRGGKENLFYIDYHSGHHRIEFSNIAKEKNPFLGRGKNYHPTGGDLDAYHLYLNYTYQPDSSTVFNLSYDHLNYDRTYKDKDGIRTAIGYVQNYHTKFEDDILSLSLNKNFHLRKATLFVGGFLKRKAFNRRGEFDTQKEHTNNSFYISSLYADFRYDFDTTTALLLSAKADLYQYDKRIPDNLEQILRIAFLKDFGWLKSKLFLTHTYLPTPFYKLCSCGNLPFKANPNLKNPKVDLALLRLEFPFANGLGYINVGKKRAKNTITPSSPFINTPQTLSSSHIEIGQEIQEDRFNLRYSLYWAKNSKHLQLSPSRGAIVEFIYHVDSTDLYQELLYKSSYNYYGTRVDDSYEYSFAIKRHFTKDFSVGIRGENIFGTGMKQKYRKADQLFPIRDRRYILNAEYRF